MTTSSARQSARCALRVSSRFVQVPGCGIPYSWGPRKELHMTIAYHLAHLALLVLAGAILGCSSRVPARVETVNGHQVEIATAGTGGTATVVFEAGLGEDWTHWDQVASEVARHARVFAYSRPGFGASDPMTTPRDPK